METTNAPTPWYFAWALRNGEVAMVYEYLVRHDLPARAAQEDEVEDGVAQRMAADWMQAEITRREQTHSSLTSDVPWCLLRTLYAAHYTEQLAPVAHALADPTCYLLCQLSENCQLEELDVVLCSWVFNGYMDHERQSDALALAWRNARSGQVACVLLAHGFDPQHATICDSAVYPGTFDWQLPMLLRHGATAMGDPRLISADLTVSIGRGSVEWIGELLTIDAEPRGALRQAIQAILAAAKTCASKWPRRCFAMARMRISHGAARRRCYGHAIQETLRWCSCYSATERIRTLPVALKAAHHSRHYCGVAVSGWERAMASVSCCYWTTEQIRTASMLEDPRLSIGSASKWDW